jgi:NAD(P)-dependent dehydrogenase (short-subunit alcohol dehydrogenase family)
MEALLKDVKARYGRLDTIVANAVGDDHAPLGKITEDQFNKMIGTNLKGVLFAVQSATPLMSNGGSIILIASTTSVATPPGMSIYGAIKGGFHGMVRALIQDLKGTGVRINILSPGAVDTPSLRRALGKAAGAEKVHEIIQSMAQRSPLWRIGEAREIGKVAVFLASDASSYVNGVELFVDGGLTQVA